MAGGSCAGAITAARTAVGSTARQQLGVTGCLQGLAGQTGVHLQLLWMQTWAC